MKLRFLSCRLGLLDSHTRIPFRYGIACMTDCPQATLELAVETAGKPQRTHGFSGDCLPPLWFDKTLGKSFDLQIEEMQLVIRQAAEIFLHEFRSPQEFFPGWRSAYRELHRWATARNLPSLLASFGVSMIERAAMDAMLRSADRSFHQGVRENLFGIETIHPDLIGAQLRDWVPAEPLRKIYVRHTVGLTDPLTRDELSPSDDPADGFPVTLEDHLREYGIRYLKIKVSNRFEHDVQRLREIARLTEKYRGRDYFVTIDGNEQYHQAEQLDQLIDALEHEPSLETLWANTLVIEQPLARVIALDPEHTAGVRSLSARKPVIIDESDGELESFAQAIELGYRGVSTKNCKGPIKSLLNAGLIWQHNRTNRDLPLVMTAEDLCTVGVIPVQSDLCLVSTLGLEHVERNGHHYHPGLSYLPVAEQEAVLAAHRDLYCQSNERVALRITDGQLDIGSLQCVGYGFAVLPEMNARQIVWEL